MNNIKAHLPALLRKALQAGTLKGFRDFLPTEARKRQYVQNLLKTVFELYGFEPLETPALEYEEVLLGKYGEEGDKLMYRFTDNGDRRVALRYDQTVPLARVVAQYQNELPIPFKRYQIQPVWRAENTQKGRFREFLQCDIDTVGTNSPLADAEILSVIYESFKTLGLTVTIKINDRALLAKYEPKVLTSIDKLKKIGKDAVLQELKQKGVLNPEIILEEIITLKQPENLASMNAPYIQFEPTLVRGLDYYTGLIIEVECDAYPTGSLGGGGRYDNLIGIFAGKQIPAVGFAFGFDRIMEAMEQLNLFPENLNATKVLVTVFSKNLEDKSIEIAEKLRSKKINCELWLDPESKLEKQLKYADQKGIPYVLIIGPNEAAENKITLKDLKNKTQETLTLDEIVSKLTS